MSRAALCDGELDCPDRSDESTAVQCTVDSADAAGALCRSAARAAGWGSGAASAAAAVSRSGDAATQSQIAG